MAEFVPLDAGALSSKLDFADEAAAVEKQRERRRWDAAYGPPPANGIKAGVLSSDAESGWVYCVRHGNLPCVNSTTGERDYTGVCQQCFREDHSPEVARRRQAEVEAAVRAEEAAVRSKAAEYEAMVRGQMDGPAEEAVVLGAEQAPVDAGHGPPAGSVGPGPPSPGSPATFHVEQPVRHVGPGDGPGPNRAHGTPDWAWLAGVEDDGSR